VQGGGRDLCLTPSLNGVEIYQLPEAGERPTRKGTHILRRGLKKVDGQLGGTLAIRTRGKSLLAGILRKKFFVWEEGRSRVFYRIERRKSRSGRQGGEKGLI